MREAPEFLGPVEFSDYFRCVKDIPIGCVFSSVIVMSTGSDNLKEFVIGRSTARKVIEFQEFVIGRPTERKVIDSRNLWSVIQ